MAFCYFPEETDFLDLTLDRIAIGFGRIDKLNGLPLRQINSNNPNDVQVNPPDPKFVQEHSYYVGDPLYWTWDIYQRALEQ